MTCGTLLSVPEWLFNRETFKGTHERRADGKLNLVTRSCVMVDFQAMARVAGLCSRLRMSVRARHWRVTPNMVGTVRVLSLMMRFIPPVFELLQMLGLIVVA